MKFWELEHFIMKEAKQLRENSIRNGKFNDGRSKKLLDDFSDFKNQVVFDETLHSEDGSLDLVENVESILDSNKNKHVFLVVKKLMLMQKNQKK